MQKIWNEQKTQELQEMLKQQKDLNVFEVCKHFKCSMTVVKQKILSLQKGIENSFKKDETKLTNDEKLKLIQLLNQDPKPTPSQLSEIFKKEITANFCKKVLNAPWKPEDVEKLHKLFGQFQNGQNIDYYYSQFTKEQYRFVQSELSFITRKNRSLMPQHSAMWNQQKEEQLLNLNKKYGQNYTVIAKELGFDGQEEKVKQKLQQLIKHKSAYDMVKIQKILNKKK